MLVYDESILLKDGSCNGEMQESLHPHFNETGHRGEQMVSSIPNLRIRAGNRFRVNPGGVFVLYWMIANRRAYWNYSLDRAIEWARELKKPLVVLEALRCAYPWASDRLHALVLQGMADNERRLKGEGILYYPYLEDTPGRGKGLLETLAKEACVVVTDDFPDFFLPRMVAAASGKLPVLMELVDSNGLMPMQVADQIFKTAYAFRRFLQKNLLPHLTEHPNPDPLNGLRLPELQTAPRDFLRKWPPAVLKSGKKMKELLAKLPIDHRVGVVEGEGGAVRAERKLQEFLKNGLPVYTQKRNDPETEVTSGLSPYLHFGHISVHQIFHEVVKREEWFFDRMAPGADGRRQGWWGMSENAEAFLDQLITWRELGFNMCSKTRDYDRYESLPSWALDTLSQHEGDARPVLYTQKELESASTHDALWNAAQRQLVREGCIHNYLRMLWGKKILQWSPTPRNALEIMMELNNKYALDGRDPNSYSGIFWILGRYDRAWGPERPIFGKIRYMSSRNTARKLRVKGYLKRYGVEPLKKERAEKTEIKWDSA